VFQQVDALRAELERAREDLQLLAACTERLQEATEAEARWFGAALWQALLSCCGLRSSLGGGRERWRGADPSSSLNFSRSGKYAAVSASDVIGGSSSGRSRGTNNSSHSSHSSHSSGHGGPGEEDVVLGGGGGLESELLGPHSSSRSNAPAVATTQILKDKSSAR
jgi:hypothetical protein